MTIHDHQVHNTSPDLHVVILVPNLLPDHVHCQSLFITTLQLDTQAQYIKLAVYTENALVSQTTPYINIVHTERNHTNGTLIIHTYSNK